MLHTFPSVMSLVLAAYFWLDDIKRGLRECLLPWRQDNAPRGFHGGVRLSVEGLEERAVPATITWLGGMSSSWMFGANWVGGAVPGPNDDVIIDAGTNSPSLMAGTT